MPLFETIIDANHWAVAGGAGAGLHPAGLADSLLVLDAGVFSTAFLGAKHLGLLAQFNQGFSSGPPAIFMFFFVTIFVVIIGTVLFRAVKGVSEWSDNNQQPVLTVPARMVTKREDVSISSHHHDDNHHHSTSSSTSYFATFEFSSGDRKEFEVSESQFGLLVEGDKGSLTFQGTRYKGFQRELAGNKAPSSSEETVTSANLENESAVEEQASDHSFCPYCGVEVEGSFKFCPHCGKEQPVYTSQV